MPLRCRQPSTRGKQSCGPGESDERRFTRGGIDDLCRNCAEVRVSTESLAVSGPSAPGCKSVAKASKVRILHLPRRAPRGPDQRKRCSGPLSRLLLEWAWKAATGGLRRDFDAASEDPQSGGARRAPDASPRQGLSVANTRRKARRPWSFRRSYGFAATDSEPAR